jgi:hypothetical protein
MNHDQRFEGTGGKTLDDPSGFELSVGICTLADGTSDNALD